MPRSRELSPTLRARLCELRDIGWSFTKIHARYPDIPYSTIRYTIKKDSQRHQQQSVQRSGRPKVISSEEQQQLLDLVRQDEHIKLRDLSQAIQSNPSIRSVQRLFQTQMSPSKVASPSSSILIVGAGTWGCSTALHLARRGYRHVTVLDPHPVPSPIAAGNDVNKIMEHKDVTDPNAGPHSIAFATCTKAALNGWRTDPVFKPYFHETGFIIAAHTPALINHIREDEIYPSESDFVKLETADDFRKTMPRGVLTGDFPGWKGWLKKGDAGWIHARKAMVSAFDEAKRLGVRFIAGSPQGNAVSLVYQNGDVVGAQTEDGSVHRADRTIVSAGAGTDRLLDLKKQLRPTAWTLCHIKMTSEETKLYRNLPVLFNAGKGFFMEPDEDGHELKICDEHPGYINWVPDPHHPGEKRSIPFAKQQIPLEAEKRARSFLKDTMPHLADRPLSFARICWDADTTDRFFLIDKHPQHPSLLVACGGSGNGAMQIPTIGGFISDALEGKLQKELKHVCRWRPEMAVGRDWKSTQNRFGGPDRVMDFQDVGDDEWTSLRERGSRL